MIRNGSKWTAALVLAGFAGVAAPARAQQATDARIQELVRAAAERIGAGKAVSDQAAAQTVLTGSTVPLSLDDAVKLALDRNLDIAVQRLNPQTFDYNILSLQAAFKPALTSQVSSQSVLNPAQNTIQGVPAGEVGITQGTTIGNAGLTQNLKWGGGGYTLTLNNNKQTTNSTTSTLNPAYNTSYSAQYTQPLLRGFRIDSTRQQLQVTRLNQEISETQLQASIINTLSNVRNAYWDYVFAVQAVDVAKESLDLANKLVQDNQTRVEVGTMAPIDVVQAQSEAATRRQALVAAQATKQTTELALKRLIVNGTQDSNWNARLDPTDRPEFRPEPIDVSGAVTRALSARTDLTIAKKNLDANDVTVKLLKNQLLPQVDFVGRYGLVGRGGTQITRNGTGLGAGQSQIVNTIPGGFADAFNTMFSNDYPTWTLQLNLSYPLGKSTAEANLARANIQQSQVEAQMKQIELQVATDVTNAAITAQTNGEAVQAAQAARELAQKKLEAEQSKFEVGMSTNYFVVQAQRDLRDAQNSELQAVLNYRKALVEFERLQQTTLQNLGITVINAAGVGTTGGGAGTGGTRATVGGQGQQ
jgi:outer membrane protein TolC